MPNLAGDPWLLDAGLMQKAGGATPPQLFSSLSFLRADSTAGMFAVNALCFSAHTVHFLAGAMKSKRLVKKKPPKRERPVFRPTVTSPGRIPFTATAPLPRCFAELSPGASLHFGVTEHYTAQTPSTSLKVECVCSFGGDCFGLSASGSLCCQVLSESRFGGLLS